MAEGSLLPPPHSQPSSRCPREGEGEGGFPLALISCGDGWLADSQALGGSCADSPSPSPGSGVGMFAHPLLFLVALSCFCSGCGRQGRGHLCCEPWAEKGAVLSVSPAGTVTWGTVGCVVLAAWLCSSHIPHIQPSDHASQQQLSFGRGLRQAGFVPQAGLVVGSRAGCCKDHCGQPGLGCAVGAWQCGDGCLGPQPIVRGCSEVFLRR